MPPHKQQLQDTLNKVALIVRKYNLGDRNYFFGKFTTVDKKYLNTAWTYGQTIIQNREIIKDGTGISEVENKFALEKFYELKRDSESLFFFLNKGFDPKSLKLTDENIQRRLRHKAAILYVELSVTGANETFKQLKSSIGERFKNTIYKIRKPLIICGVVGIFFIARIIEGLTPIDKITKKIHEESKREFDGAVCNDGKISHSQGRGTCSWHDGVDYYFYKGEYTKTWDECEKEAKKLSWRD